MAVKLSPIGNDAPFVDANGDPLSGGKLYIYLATSSTPVTTYQDSGSVTQNANPVVLNSNGYPASGGSVVEIWLTTGASYKFVLKTSAGVTVWSRDNVTAINDTSVSIDEWVSGPAPTYVSATSFTLVGDQTSTFNVGRRVKTTNSGGTVYSTIKTSAFGAVTTVTVVNDSSTLDSGLSAVSYALQSASNPSVPLLTDAYPLRSGSSDKTKKVLLEVDGLTTDTTRTITMPDADVTLLTVATQAQQETGTSLLAAVTPGRQQSHPSAAKAWCHNDTGSTVTAGYNISSITDTGTGDHTFSFTTAFSSVNYATIATAKAVFGGSAVTTLVAVVSNDSNNAGSVQIYVLRVSDGAKADPNFWQMACFGDQ